MTDENGETKVSPFFFLKMWQFCEKMCNFVSEIETLLHFLKPIDKTMKMSKMIPMALLAALPMAGMAQNKSGLKMENLDMTVKPAEDFYMFATGGWQ